MSPMNNRLLVPRKTPGLLDLVPGAAAAYSLRSLSNSYAGPVVTVRRSSDDAEEDFTASEVADGTLAAFCGAGDGFVKQWWDQSGNARHAVSPADANEPQIVNAGVVVLAEGTPAIQFDGSSDYMHGGLSAASGFNVSAACVFSLGSTTLGSEGVVFQATPVYPSSPAYLSIGTNKQEASSIGSNIVSANSAVVNLGGSVSPLQSILLCYADLSVGTPPSSMHINGATALQSYSGRGLRGDDAQLGAAIVIGRRDDGFAAYYFDGKMQELIIWQSDVSSQRELLEGQIAWSYSV